MPGLTVEVHMGLTPAPAGTLMMSQRNGLQIIRRRRSQHPTVRFMVLVCFIRKPPQFPVPLFRSCAAVCDDSLIRVLGLRRFVTSQTSGRCALRLPFS